MSTELELHQSAGMSLPEKMKYAEALASASLLPKSYQRQPGNVLLAMELGDALGIRPIQAINAVHVIEGKPSASADLIASLIRKAGHKLRIRGNDTEATAELIRADDPDYTFSVTWTLDRARTAGLLGKGVWKSYPAAMLKARAITEVAREGASDALYGVIYTPEELGANVDGDGAPLEAPRQAQQQPAPQPRKPATLSEAMANAAPTPAPEPEPEIEDLGEKTEPIEDGPELITESQMKMMFSLLNKNGFAEDGTTAQRDYLESIIGRKLTSRKDITKAEATRVIDLLNDASDEASAA